MKTKTTFKKIFLAFIFLFSSTQVFSMDLSEVRGEVALGAFFFEPSGTHSYSKTKAGTALDLESDMNLSDDNFLFGRLKIEGLPVLPGFQLDASILEADGTGKKAFTYGDLSYVDSSSFDSKITLSRYDLSLFYAIKGITTGTLGMVKFDVGGTLRWFDAEGKVSQASASSVTINETDYSIAFFADLRVRPIKNLEVGLEWKGLSFTDSRFSSLVGRVSYQVLGPMFVSAGYAIENMDVDQNGFKLDIDTNGAFIEAGYRF